MNMGADNWLTLTEMVGRDAAERGGIGKRAGKGYSFS
jgi:hypothetical protein